MHIDFNPSGGPSLGVEVEYELIDRTTRELASGSLPILEQMGAGHPDGEHPKAKHELFQCTIEVITGICTSVAEAKADLRSTLTDVQVMADDRGLDVMCSGTHPFSDWRSQAITPNPRYEELVREMAWMAERLQIFGVHFHVGIRSAEKVVAIANALSTYIPHLLALSSSSPFWDGHDTGLASSRSKVFEGLPTAGLPEQIDDWPDFERFMGTLVSASAIKTVREVWWDIRPHPDFGTVELRMCDGIPTLREVAALAAVAQCLVQWFDDADDRGEQLPVPREWILRQNKWRAARHGIDADLIIDEDGACQPLRQGVEELVAQLTPVAVELGCSEELGDVATILDVGPSCVRQRRMAQTDAGLTGVVDLLVAELAADRPLRPEDLTP